MVTKNGTMVEISGMPTRKNGKTLSQAILDEHLLNKPHVGRVKKAMLMQIEEMSKHPNWIAYYCNSQNENKDIPNMGNNREGVV